MKRAAEKRENGQDPKRHAVVAAGAPDTSSSSSSVPSTSPPSNPATNATASGASPAAALAPVQPTFDASQQQQVMKFLVPNDKAGAVIGRGGESIAKTRQISGAIVKIDKGEFGADRTVTVQGTATQIQTAYSDIMMNLQRAGVTDPSQLQPTARAADETTIQVLVPVGKVGGLIGKGGSSISEIRSTSGCFVKVASVQDTPPGATDRVVTLRGSPVAIQLAQQLIINKLATVEDRGGGGGGGGHSWQQQQQQYASTAGAYEWTHAHAQMGLQPSMPLPGAAAPMGGQFGGQYGLDAATLAWYNQQAAMGMGGGMPQHGGMQQQQQQQGGGGGVAQQGGQTQIKMSVSGDVAGRIIGRGGSSINEIRRASGARVEVGPRGDSQHAMREITITGTASQNQAAQYLIGLKMVEAGASSGGSGHN